MKINNKSKKALTFLCNHIVSSQVRKNDPNKYWKRKASDLDVVTHIESLLNILPRSQQKELLRFSKLLSSKLLGLTWNGKFSPVQNLNKKQLNTMLNRWLQSPFNNIRKAHSSIIKLCTYYYFIVKDEHNQNPNWKTLGYKGDLGYRPVSHSAIKPLQIESKKVLETHYLIIGSGSGGGVIASELSSRNKDTLIVEKGPFKMPMHMNHNEEDMHSALYEQQGMLNTINGGMTILAGSCFGGGTTVNWAGSFRTPDYILEEWAKNFKNPHFIDPKYQAGFDVVEKKINVQKKINKHNPQNELLWKAGIESNLNPEVVPRNVKINDQLNDHWQWHGQGYSSLGNSFRIKQSTAVSYLEGASQRGLKVLCDTQIIKLIIDKGKVVGAIGKHKDGHEIIIHALCVILAAGAIHSPAILLRSNLRHSQLGKNLFLHPTVVSSAIYNQKINAWFGPMMSTVIDDYTHINKNHGFKIETAPFHPGFASVVVPYKNSIEFKTDMLSLSHMAHFVALVRDKYGGKIKVNAQGRAIIKYSIHSHDLKTIQKGTQAIIKLHHKAGALKIFHPNQLADALIPSKQNQEDYFNTNKSISWKPNQFKVGSAHQMGTCRMSGDRSKGITKPSGESWLAGGLYIADASLFPTASGVNPMLSIQALAYHISKNIP